MKVPRDQLLQEYEKLPDRDKENFFKDMIRKNPQSLEDVVKESFKSLGDEQKKQVATATVKGVPQPLQEDLVKESFKSLGDEQKKRVAAAAMKGVPQPLQEDLVRDVATSTLDTKYSWAQKRSEFDKRKEKEVS